MRAGSDFTSESSGSGFQRVFELAQGGMGRVDLVVRKRGGFERVCVAKRLHTGMRDEASLRAMFLDEARIAGLIRHANVVSVLDAGEDSEGPYLLMDYVDGVTLGEFVRRHAEKGALVPIQLCARIAAQVAEGLHAAHELTGPDGSALGLVHRDVSPQNVLVGYDGVCRVTDFGIAKALGQASKTATGVFKGKLGYMSPEQLRFEKIDRRSDLFSLGVVLYELLTARRLYRSQDDSEGPFRILNEPPPDLGVEREGTPADLVELGFELLAKKRDARPSSARDVARRLEAISSELAAVEGQVELTDYLDARFSSDREAQRAKIRAALDSLTRPPPVASAPPPRRTGSRTVAAIVALTLATALAVALVVRQRLRAGATPETLPPAASAPGVARVSLTITTEPEGAELVIDGVKSGMTPASVKLERTTAARELTLKKDGFVTVARSVVPDTDRELHVELAKAEGSASAPVAPTQTSRVPTAVRPRSTKPAPSSPPAASKPQFGRFP